MKISVVIPVYKNKEFFLRNLAHNHQFFKNCQVIIIDDGSQEDLQSQVKKIFPSIIFLENKTNLGFSKTVNYGVRYVNGDLILLLNSDVKLIDDSFKNLTQKFKNDKDLFAVSFLQVEKNGNCVGKNIIYFKRGLIFHNKAKGITPGLNAWAEGGACVIRKKYFDELDGFDEIYSPFYWEDIDLSYRAYKKGWKIIFNPDIKVHHYHESTISRYFHRNFIRTIAYRNQLIFIWKNITDKKLILSHLFFLPYHLIYFLYKKEKEFFVGFLKALILIKKIIRMRNLGKKEQSDSSILKLFV